MESEELRVESFSPLFFLDRGDKDNRGSKV